MTGTRAAAREALTAKIIEEARVQLGSVGPVALSLRSIAREVGMVSSAIYRYFPSRDALLTALIVEAYDRLGEVAESAAVESARKKPVARWVAVAVAIREWAIGHPHEYALLYGTPVPGYTAPDDTVVPGTRVSLALLGIVADAAPVTGGRSRIPKSVRADLVTIKSFAGHEDLEEAAVLAVLGAWTQLFGLISFELFGQTRGMVTDHGVLFATLAESSAEACLGRTAGNGSGG